jgi:hypothetical protein
LFILRCYSSPSAPCAQHRYQFAKLVALLQDQQKSIDGAKLMSRSTTSAQLGHRPSKVRGRQLRVCSHLPSSPSLDACKSGIRSADFFAHVCCDTLAIAPLAYHAAQNSEDQQKMQSLTIYVEARGSFERLRCSHAAEQAQLLALAAVLGPACPPVLSPADLAAEIPEADGVVSRPRLLSTTLTAGSGAAGGAAALRDPRGCALVAFCLSAF